MIKMTAKFTSSCAETGQQLKKGTTIFYDRQARKAYHPDSPKAKAWEAGEDARSTAGMVSAQEDAYWDNMTGGYYSR